MFNKAKSSISFYGFTQFSGGFLMEKIASIAIALAAIALIASAFGALSNSGSAAAGQDALDTIRASGEMAACYVSYPPFSYKDDSGKMQGIGVDIIESIAQKSGFKLKYVETTWGNLVLDLKSGRCQANVSGIFPLIERSYGGVMFSEPHSFLGNNGAVKKDDTRFHSLEELNREDVTVAVAAGEQGHIYAQKFLPKAKLHVISSGDISLAFVEVSAGRADVGLGDSITLEQYMAQHDDIKPLLEKPYLLRGLTIAVKEDDLKLLNFFNNAISVLSTSGELKEIYAKYQFKSIVPKQ